MSVTAEVSAAAQARIDRAIDVAWAAGFLEGEGCFGWYGKQGYPLVSACQKEREPLDHLVEIFGGKVEFTNPPSRKNPIYLWRVINLDAVKIMAEVFLLMSERRQVQIRESVANFADREADRTKRKLRCKNGHLRHIHSVRRIVRGRAESQCKGCQRDYSRGIRRGVPA